VFLYMATCRLRIPAVAHRAGEGAIVGSFHQGA
jgi:hypothetical protein